jgi:hypothetical protein
MTSRNLLQAEVGDGVVEAPRRELDVIDTPLLGWMLMTLKRATSDCLYEGAVAGGVLEGKVPDNVETPMPETDNRVRVLKKEQATTVGGVGAGATLADVA